MQKKAMPRGAGEPRPRIWIVDDEPDIADVLARVVRTCGDYQIEIQRMPFDLDRAIAQSSPDLVFLDLVMPGVDGFRVMSRLREIDPTIVVVVVSAYGTVENAVRAVKAGAFDFLSKPFDPDDVELMVAKVEREFDLRARYRELNRSLREADPHLRAIVGDSPAMVNLRNWILKVRPVTASVMISGESGTGKELVTRAIHAGRGPFVAINMAAIPEELADSELFGHRQGAFTGATHERRGLLVEASGGTLFLDEVNAMSPLLQAKLLRVIEERQVRPVGSDREFEVDFRLISATNEDLDKLVLQGRFRRDLYHRLKVLNVTLPPLRERREDIPQLAEDFLQRYVRAHGSSVRRFSPEALQVLLQDGWPGNVRELENFIEETVILAQAGAYEITPAMLPGHATDKDHAASTGGTATLAEMELRYINQVLNLTGGNKARAARILKIDYKTLLRKLGTSHRPEQAEASGS